MACCSEPDVSHNPDTKSATCRGCGFSYVLKKHGKRATRETWKPKWYCEDDYDRAWRLRGFERHEVVGTRRIGKKRFYMIACPKGSIMFSVPFTPAPDEVYCASCDRAGMFGPMLVRQRERKSGSDKAGDSDSPVGDDGFGDLLDL